MSEHDETTMLVTQDDAAVPLFDTTVIHAQRAVEIALEEEKALAIRGEV